VVNGIAKRLIDVALGTRVKGNHLTDGHSFLPVALWPTLRLSGRSRKPTVPILFCLE
jgi:hypothetical protein